MKIQNTQTFFFSLKRKYCENLRKPKLGILRILMQNVVESLKKNYLKILEHSSLVMMTNYMNIVNHIIIVIL